MLHPGVVSCSLESVLENPFLEFGMSLKGINLQALMLHETRERLRDVYIVVLIV
jgi:hypothetical protein